MDEPMLQLKNIGELAQLKCVSFSINYCESDDSWYCCISSIAPSESWVGKNHSLEIAIELLVKHLNHL